MTQDWKETLQSEIIEHYVFLAEMKQHAKDRTGHMVEMREQWGKLCGFIESLLKEERDAVLLENKKRLLEYMNAQHKTENGIIYVPECELDQIL